MSTTRLIICGAFGRMGQATAKLAARDRSFSITAGVTLDPYATPPAPFPVIPLAELDDYAEKSDVWIDFTSPEASAYYAERAAYFKKKIVIGTTGHNPTQLKAIQKAAKKTAVLMTPNFSLGMNALFQISEYAAAVLRGYEPRIQETHHIHKKDSPSGSAKRLAALVEKAAKLKQPVSIESFRQGETVGDHNLILEGPFEAVRISHSAKSRSAFAQGALQGALRLKSKKPGLYDLNDLFKISA